jgi:histone H3/H4
MNAAQLYGDIDAIDMLIDMENLQFAQNANLNESDLSDDSSDSDESEDEETLIELSDHESDIERVESDDDADDSDEDEDVNERGPAPKRQRKNGDEEIKLYQNSTHQIIPRAAFERLVRETAQDFKTDLRFTPDAIDALQEISETYLAELFQDCELIAYSNNRMLITPQDMKLARMLRKRHRSRNSIYQLD